jgi:hypothetical protein
VGVEWIWESIVVMAQVPHVKTCLAIYQQSQISPIQYPVGRLRCNHHIAIARRCQRRFVR